MRQLLRSLFGVLPTLDLHGLGVNDALREVEVFLRAAATSGASCVRLVYGKGRGSPGGRAVLRHVVPRWLENEGAIWVERFERRLDGTGEDGSVVVWLRRRSTAETPTRQERPPGSS